MPARNLKQLGINGKEILTPSLTVRAGEFFNRLARQRTVGYLLTMLRI
jgi:hypothetical protein